MVTGQDLTRCPSTSKQCQASRRLRLWSLHGKVQNGVGHGVSHMVLNQKNEIARSVGAHISDFYLRVRTHFFAAFLVFYIFIRYVWARLSKKVLEKFYSSTRVGVRGLDVACLH